MVPSTFYLVRSRDTGGNYITERTLRGSNCTDKYRWVKDRASASVLTYDAAQKVRQNYGGEIVRCDVVEEVL